MLLVLLACAAPVIASYVVFYGVRPEGRTNYGELLSPQVALPPVSRLAVTDLQDSPLDLNQLRGNWLMLTTDSGNCDGACQKKLYWMRQLKTAQGREKTRVDRLWIANDSAPLSTTVMREFEGTVFLRAPAAQLAAWLPVPAGGVAQDHIYLMDPQGNVMLRWPKEADADRIKRDLSKLLRASNAWQKEKPPSLDTKTP